MRIGIDAMGGDYAPVEILKGAALYKESVPSGIDLVLIGQKKVLQEELTKLQLAVDSFEIIDATEVILMAEHPTKALSKKPDSSIAKGFGLLKQKNIDAFVGVGNTGAMLVGAIYAIQNIPGVIRPTISASIPKPSGKFGVLLDVGANSDCKPDILYQFGILGSLYAKHVIKIDNPAVGLMNIGEEEGKGNLLTQATYPLMKDSDKFNFIGNVEGRDIFSDKADVIVCDGFTGNVILKTLEGMYDVMKSLTKGNDEVIGKFDHENYGGTPILGTNAPVIIGHGISKAKSIKNMIALSKTVVESNLVEIFKDTFN